jgi:hypothetical protein
VPEVQSCPNVPRSASSSQLEEPHLCLCVHHVSLAALDGEVYASKPRIDAALGVDFWGSHPGFTPGQVGWGAWV